MKKVNDKVIKENTDKFFNILSRTKRFLKNILITTTKIVITMTYHVIASVEFLTKELEGVLKRIKDNQKRRFDSVKKEDPKLSRKYIKRINNVNFLLNVINRIKSSLDNINDTVDEVVEWLDDRMDRVYSSADLLNENKISEEEFKRHPHKGEVKNVSISRSKTAINAGDMEYSYRELGNGKFRFEIRFDDNNNPDSNVKINKKSLRKIGKKLFCNEVLNRIYQDQFNNMIKPEF